jgi:Kef-type K+ transport system membrane component KefB/Trk K+ transport system NAD-binding subunit
MDLFIELSLIIVVAMVVTSIIRLLRQPMIIGYIITGIILSPHFLGLIRSNESMLVFSQIGIALLLFIVGLNLNPKVLKDFGLGPLIAGGIGQVVFTFIVGFFIIRAFSFDILTSLYIAIALTFSSTIIIMKLLSDKNDLDTIYGRFATGFLIIQDIVVIALLIIISSTTSGGSLSSLLFKTLLLGILLIIALVFIAKYLLPHLCTFFARSQEYLFLFSIGWGLGLATLFHLINFSIEIGALIAGITLALSPYHYEISAKLKPLRDFFIILFFISLGSQLVFESVGKFIVPIIILSLVVLIGDTIIVMVLMGLLGYGKRIGFFTGLTMAQISEFSLILIALGVKIGHLTTDVLSMVTIIGLITIAGSTYLIMYAEKIYPYLAPFLGIFERKNAKESKKKVREYNVILFGYNRIGYDILDSFKKIKKKFLVVDYNPDTISDLTKSGVNCIYGDANDSELLDELDLKNVKMIISTIPEFEANLVLLNKVRRVNKKSIVILVSHQIDEAKVFYDNGASYVLMPHFLGGHYASNMIIKHGFNRKKFLGEKRKHITHLKRRKKIGHEHPNIEKHR